MANKRKPTLADRVEATERRDAPRAQARVSRGGLHWTVSLSLAVLALMLMAGVVIFLRFKQMI